ncbi:MAG: metal ABC transporter permease [Planctomycetota bacterium]|nr:metal ABC transporter permease [Planctomycetota bacterium]MDA1163530.1 metal ABC transporter permease [Planctomycetota bacterium]
MVIVFVFFLFVFPTTTFASDSNAILRVLTLQDYNTRVVLLGTMLLGVTSGIVGTFMLLRRQALIGDVVSHAALPGVAIAFLIGEAFSPGSGRSLHWLLVGAASTGLLAVVCVGIIRRFSVVKPDAALATVLGVFFGFGAVLFKTVQELPSGNQAGLQQFILGSASTMIAADVVMIAKAAAVVLVLSLLLLKELSILSFDEDFAAVQGWPVGLLDLGLTGLVVGITVIGLESVGILMVALLITPPTAARFWTDNFAKMTLVAALIGGASATTGSLLSAMVPKLAGGPTIVLAGTAFFILSMLFGTRRGIVHRWLQQIRNRRRIGRDDLVRAMYEIIEARLSPASDSSTGDSLPDCEIARDDIDPFSRQAVELAELFRHRSWPLRRVKQTVAVAEREGIIRMDSETGWRLTKAGATAARRAVRNHRLWEMYLISQAEIAPSHVDRDADNIEHILGPEIVEQLESLVASRVPRTSVPPSPHPV